MSTGILKQCCLFWLPRILVRNQIGDPRSHAYRDRVPICLVVRMSRQNGYTLKAFSKQQNERIDFGLTFPGDMEEWSRVDGELLCSSFANSKRQWYLGTSRFSVRRKSSIVLPELPCFIKGSSSKIHRRGVGFLEAQVVQKHLQPLDPVGDVRIDI